MWLEPLEDRITPSTGSFFSDGVGVYGSQDQGIFGFWNLRSELSAGVADAGNFAFGARGWIPVVGDWTGSGHDGIGVVDPSGPISLAWHLRNELSGGDADAGSFPFGARGWIPVVGDWTGSGHDGIGVVDPSGPRYLTWYLRNEPSGGTADAGSFVFGLAAWIPVVGDWTGSGHDGIGAFDPSTATWYLRNEPSGGVADAGSFQFGAPGWIPVVGDWNGSGHDGIGVIDPSTGTWYLRNELSAGVPDAGSFPFGARQADQGFGATPVVGDWGTVRETPTTTVTGTPNPAVLGQSVILTASVSPPPGAPAGTVTFTVDGAPQAPAPLDAKGTAVFPISTLTVGAHTITAKYNGGGTFAGGASQPFTETVVAPTLTGDVIVTGGPGDNTLIVTATGPDSGYYTLNDGSRTYFTDVTSFTFQGGAGQNTFSLELLPGGSFAPSGGVFYDGGPGGKGVLAVTAGGMTSQEGPGRISFGDPLTIHYTGVASIVIDGAASVGAIAGPDTADRAAALAGLTPQERFVQALYLDELGRPGATAELDGWVTLLDGPGGSAALVAAGIEHGPEAQDNLVKSWYVSFLGRTAQGGEEQGWVHLLQQGQTEEQVLSQILAGPEFYAHAQTLSSTGSADANYVQALYQLLLGRSGGSDEVAGWVQALPAPGRQGAALDFLTGPEFRTDQFEGYYDALLHRPSDPAGLNGWAFSNLDMAMVRVGFEAAPEFYGNG